MTIEQLNSVVEIADTGSFSKAARALHMSQPNLSYTVKTIEEQIGTPIFDRTTEGVILTEKGKELVQQLRFLKNDYALVNEILHNDRSFTQKETLRISTLNLITARSAFSELTKKYQNKPINFSLTDYNSLTGVLRHINEVDISVIGMINTYVNHLKKDLYNLSLEYHPIAKLDCFALVGKNNPFYNLDREYLTISELKNNTLLQYLEDPNNPQQSVIHALGLYNSSYGKVIINSADAFYDIIKTTPIIGIDFVSEDNFLSVNKIRNLRLFSIKDCSFSWEVAWIKKQHQQVSALSLE